MRIIYLANARIPTEKAHGLQIMQMCTAFASIDRTEVELIIPRRLNSIRSDVSEYYGIKSNFKITKLPCVDFLPLNRWLGRFAYLSQVFTFLIAAKIYLIFKRYDLLYTRELYAGLFFKGIVLEIHALPNIRKWHIRSWHKAKSMVVLTPFIRKSMIFSGADERKITVEQDAVDLEKFNIDFDKTEARKKIGLPLGDIIIGYVGTLRTMGMDKGVESAIKSLQFLGKNVKLVLVGGTPEDIKYYKKGCDGLGTKQPVFIGHVKHSLIPVYLRSFDILIAPFPSNEHYDHFMSPLKIFEYMASGRPIVATDLPSLREILNESNSVLVRPGDPEKLAEGIMKIVEDKDMADKISFLLFRSTALSNS